MRAGSRGKGSKKRSRRIVHPSSCTGETKGETDAQPEYEGPGRQCRGVGERRGQSLIESSDRARYKRAAPCCRCCCACCSCCLFRRHSCTRAVRRARNYTTDALLCPFTWEQGPAEGNGRHCACVCFGTSRVNNKKETTVHHLSGLHRKGFAFLFFLWGG